MTEERVIMVVMEKEIGERISIRLDPELVKRLNAWAKRQTVPPRPTDIVHTALEEFLNKEEKPDPPPRRK